MKDKFYITTAIAYASSKPHFGNTYEIILADAVARYKRLDGYDVFLCTGTDEHGQKIEKKANDKGVTPKEYVDGIASQVKSVWDSMNTSYDYFIRTTDDYHERAVKHIFKKMFDKGDIYLGAYEGWYCTECEAFFTDSQLADGKCPDCHRDVNRASEKAYFFKMSKYADRLIDYIEKTEGFIEPEARKKEMINNFLKPGLHDLCVSRTSFKWGIGVDFDPEHVVYVWLDALVNYITALGYDPLNEDQGEKFNKYWPCDVHIIGKDIMRFHSIYWPIFLMSLDLPLPKKIFGHPWYNVGADQEKMSKSRGNVIYADELAGYFTADGVRFYALSEMPYVNDGTITYEAVLNKYNTDLANNLGNLVNRTVAMTNKYFDGVIPSPTDKEELDEDLISCCLKTVKDFKGAMDTYHISDAVASVIGLLNRTNKYIDETMPWALAKDESKKGRLGTVLYNLLESIRFASLMLNPIIPESSEKILSEIGAEKEGYETLSSFGRLKSDGKVGEAVPIFVRINDKEFFEKLESDLAAKEEKKDPVTEDTSHLPEVSIEDFASLELRCGKILSAEKIKKAKKLLLLRVSLGFEERQIVSGIALSYEPEDLIGKRVIVVSNLKKAVLCGVESEGMILASGHDDKIDVVFLDENVPLGERLR